MMKYDPQCNVKINNIVLHTVEYEKSDIYDQSEQWETISVEAEGPAKTASLTLLKSAINKLRNEHRMHRYLHLHHTLIIYLFVGWICVCTAIVWYKRKSSKSIHPNITISS